MDLELTDKVALVTGGTRGIGFAIARAFAAEGARVAICARDQAELNAARGRLEADGAKVFAATADLADADAYRRWVDGAAGALDGLDCFVQNVSAGGGSDGERSWEKNFQLDVLGSVRAVDYAVPHLQRRGGSLVFIGTTAAVETFVRPQAYNAMKAAVITYAKQVSQVVGAQGIRVNVVSPGPIEFEGGSWATIRENMPDFYRATVAATPLGRLGTPEEVARAVVFLSSPAASWVSGTNLIIDGGYTKRVQF